MKRVSEYKRFIGLILSFFMLIIGICLIGEQTDSSFAFKNKSLSVQKLNDVPMDLQEKLYANEAESMKEFFSRSKGKINPQRSVRNSKTGMITCQMIVETEKPGENYWELDVALCQPDHLASVVTVHYIQHQDGV